MRLRNVKNKKEIMDNSLYLVKDPTLYKGKWKELFGNDNPIYIEIGMGKGKFIIENAIKYPNINFIGIEKSAEYCHSAMKRLEKNKLNPEVAQFHQPTLFPKVMLSIPNKKIQKEDEYRIESLF